MARGTYLKPPLHKTKPYQMRTFHFDIVHVIEKRVTDTLMIMKPNFKRSTYITKVNTRLQRRKCLVQNRDEMDGFSTLMFFPKHKKKLFSLPAELCFVRIFAPKSKAFLSEFEHTI